MSIILQKAHARLRVLNLSTTIDAAKKKEIEPVLKADFMSSEDSEYEDDAKLRERDSSGSELEDSASNGKRKKRLVKHIPPWRSRDMQIIVESLDRKIDRRRNEKAKKMCLEVTIGDVSTRPKPDGLPEWATELFD